MSFFQTFSGRRIDPLNLQPRDVDVSDIAHALSLQCRFNGHVTSFYSVAEHSVAVSRLVVMMAPGDHELAMAALLHDAAEAYLGDQVSPIKSDLFVLSDETPDGWEQFSDLENRTLDAIGEALGFQPELCGVEVVKRADVQLLADEAAELVIGPVSDWKISNIVPRVGIVRCLAPADAEAEFMNLFFRLRNLAKAG